MQPAHDQQFINELQQVKAHVYEECERNANPSTQSKSSRSKTDLIYKRVFCNYL